MFFRMFFQYSPEEKNEHPAGNIHLPCIPVTDMLTVRYASLVKYPEHP